MRIHQAREIVNRHNTKQQDEVTKRAERRKKSKRDVLLEDPFLAGQVYALGMLVLELNAVESDEQTRRESRR